ncbi:MAG: NAD(P)-dependent oxidoreductase [Bacteroidales bacterium]
MKVFLIGGTGLVGSYLLPRLIENGHEVYALTRDAGNISKISKLGAYGILGDIRNPIAFKNLLPDKPEIIILLAMPSIKPGQRLTKERKEELRSETSDFFRKSMYLATCYDCPVILPGGTSYKTEKDEVADETWPIVRKGLTEIGADTDELVNEAVRTGYPKVIQMIYGKIYGNGGLFRYMYNMTEKGRNNVIGKGDNFIPNVYAGDAASAIILALEKLPVGEKIIIADDTPVTQKEYSIYMSELMHRKRPGHIPTFLIKFILGNDFYEVIRMNCKVSNLKAKKILNWQPQFPSCKEGLEATILEIKKNG